MNRRFFVASTAAVALSVFAGAAFWYRSSRIGPAPLAADGDRLVRPHSPVVGRSDAPVTLVEFFDPSCEACRAFHPILGDILGRHPEDLRLVLRYTPLHEGSDEAVRILEAARRQEKFEVVLDALFERQPEWAVHGAPDLEKAWAVAGAAGLDLERGRRDAALPEVEAVLKQDVADLETVGIERTPTFFVDGREPAEFGPRPLYESIVAAIGRSRAAS
ncbi:DsbA family protein [Antarcticirhabdus aurantiaca]|uniref:Thioredoxin domain-containing protein n=1 Tax=Antarcticirhabdus aurantiaca TaxID=2606717 RepID=A0ACD4NXB3_9HYPH|nr:thioredoxin domain-containing protein [Antarcticirhabdus aurantiaca]WAJ31257.1 thioredoxin domain-containing protein [Jeongeuplla avenae]